MATTIDTTTLNRTPFHAFHVDHGARMVDFAGWEMPLRYHSIIEEHHQTRHSGGIFDVSHMGRLRFSGRDARAFLDRVCTRQIFGMADGQVRYSLVCNDQGGCRDDVLVYRLDQDDYLMVCNAANREKLLEHFRGLKADSVFKLDDQTFSSGMVAIQGPQVMGLLSGYSSEIASLKRFRFARLNLMALELIISRTGYSGEDGVEVIFWAGSVVARSIIKLLLKDVDSAVAEVKPAGLGARDTLRIEAAMPLYGHEITEAIDPLSAGLDFAVKLDTGLQDEQVGRFIGQDALRRIREQGPKRGRVGILLEGRRTARPSMPVVRGDVEVGRVTSGCLSPTLGTPIAMAYVGAEEVQTGGALRVDLGRASVEAEVVELPFYP